MSHPQSSPPTMWKQWAEQGGERGGVIRVLSTDRTGQGGVGWHSSSPWVRGFKEEMEPWGLGRSYASQLDGHLWRMWTKTSKAKATPEPRASANRFLTLQNNYNFHVSRIWKEHQILTAGRQGCLYTASGANLQINQTPQTLHLDFRWMPLEFGGSLCVAENRH